MQLKFFLNTQKISRHGDRPVYMYITFDGQRIRKPVTGVHTLEKYWDDEKQRIKKSGRPDLLNEVRSFNNRLEFIETQIKLVNQEAFDRRVKLTAKYILERLEDETLIKSEQFDFFKTTDQYLASIKHIQAPRTLLGKSTVFKFLKSFEASTKTKITFQDMNLSFFEELRAYAFEKQKIGDNYFSKIITVLKTFLNWAFERDFIKDQTYKKYRANERETEVICLTLNEFITLYNHSFKLKRHSQVRDVFIFGCSTGLRFSDLISLNASNIKGDYLIKNIKKTQENVMIPLNKYAKEILKKYENTLREVLPKVSAQKFNEYLKECCKEADINTPTTITRFSGGTRTETHGPKWQFITSHAGRKTFTTLSLIMGVPERVVKNITGHKKEESFRRYVNYSREFEKEQMDKVWDKI